MLSRRRLLLSGAGLAAASVLARRGRPAFAQGRPFTFVSWGGALSDAEKNAFMDPFAEKTGKEIVNTSPTAYAKLKAMVQSGYVEWDLVTVGGRFVFEGAEQDLLEPLDYAKIPNADRLPDGFKAEHGLVTSTGATVIAWNTNAFPADSGPRSWADFWDTERFPGPRGLYKPFYYNYEAALLAAGVGRDEVYPVTEEKIDLAFEKLEEIKPHVSVWWSSGAQPPQLLASGQLAMSSAWSGRMIAIEAERAPTAFTYEDGLAWGNWFVIPKGTPYREMAMEVTNYALSLEAQERLLDLVTYGPAVPDATQKASPEQRRQLVMAPQNIENMLILQEQQAALYSTKYEERWNQFQLG